MGDKNNEIEKRLQELIRQKTNENSALMKLLGKLSENRDSDSWTEDGNMAADDR